MRPFVGGREACPAVLYASLTREISRGKICRVTLETETQKSSTMQISVGMELMRLQSHEKASFCHSEWYKLKEPMIWRCFDSSLRPSHVSHLPGPATLQEVQAGPQSEQFPLSYV